MNERLIVRNFGAVKEIDIKFKKVTVFIGDQLTGKSTLAKLFSIFVWLEKRLFLCKKLISYYQNVDHFINDLCAYFHIDSYFSEAT